MRPLTDVMDTMVYALWRNVDTGSRYCIRLSYFQVSRHPVVIGSTHPLRALGIESDWKGLHRRDMKSKISWLPRKVHLGEMDGSPNSARPLIQKWRQVGWWLPTHIRKALRAYVHPKRLAILVQWSGCLLWYFIPWSRRNYFYDETPLRPVEGQIQQR